MYPLREYTHTHTHGDLLQVLNSIKGYWEIIDNDYIIINADCSNILSSLIDVSNNPIIVTDPPFNIGYHYKTYKDKLNEEVYLEGLCKILSQAPNVVVHYPTSLYKIAIKLNKAPQRVLSWVYNSNTSKQHRDIAFFDITPKMDQVRQPYKNPNDKRIKERIARGLKGAKLYDWFEINQVKNISKEKTGHPCQMPIEVMKRVIGILPYDSTIIDTYMGSGTTGVAVKIMNEEQHAKRKFIGIEIDKDYYDISRDRLELK